jgi:hypothetical protein
MGWRLSLCRSVAAVEPEARLSRPASAPVKDPPPADDETIASPATRVQSASPFISSGRESGREPPVGPSAEAAPLGGTGTTPARADAREGAPTATGAPERAARPLPAPVDVAGVYISIQTSGPGNDLPVSQWHALYTLLA